MGYTIKGRYVASCNCNMICPCPVDGVPSGPNNSCTGTAVFGVSSGDAAGVDVSGVNFALFNIFPSNLSAGNWKLGVVVDDAASEEQANALEKVLSGAEGGPFAEFAPLIGEYTGMSRAKVSMTDNGGTIGGSSFTYEGHKAPDGSAVQVSGAMFAFANPYEIGKTSGKVNEAGFSFDGSYGEAANFEYSSESTDIHPRG